MKPFSKEIIKDIPKIEGCTKQRINETLLNTIDYKIFYEAVLSILYAHALLKKKHFRSNHATLATKDFWKAVMKRAEATKQLTIISETFALVFLGNRKGLILKTLV